MALRPPRISEETREQLRLSVAAANSDEAADRVIDAVWSKLEGDMQDRITTLICAAQEVVRTKGDHLGGLERALDFLAGREVAATSDEQLRDGPWHGH